MVFRRSRVVARDTPITADNFAGHLAALHERIGDRRREIEAHPPEPRTDQSGVFTGVPDLSRQLWVVMQARRSGRTNSTPSIRNSCRACANGRWRGLVVTGSKPCSAVIRRPCEPTSRKGFRCPSSGIQPSARTPCTWPPDRRRGLLSVCFCRFGKDFTLRDGQGRLASELAYLYGEDPAMARLLGRLERREAAQTGGVVRRRVLS